MVILRLKVWKILHISCLIFSTCLGLWEQIPSPSSRYKPKSRFKCWSLERRNNPWYKPKLMYKYSNFSTNNAIRVIFWQQTFSYFRVSVVGFELSVHGYIFQICYDIIFSSTILIHQINLGNCHDHYFINQKDNELHWWFLIIR